MPTPEETPQNAWLIVTSPENFETTQNLGFTVQGVKSRHRKKAQQIRPNDKVIYYITGLQSLAGIVTVTSSYYEDQTPLWQCKSRPGEEVYPLRFHIAPEVILTPEQYLPVIDVVDQLDYLKKWPKEHWRLGFQGNIHLWPWHDYEAVRPKILSQAGKTKSKV